MYHSLQAANGQRPRWTGVAPAEPDFSRAGIRKGTGPRTMSSPRSTDARAPARGLRTVRTVAELRAALARARREGLSIGLVPTMGALHAGHISLIERARVACDLVVVSLFVNPTQFDDASDLERYPREERRDSELAAQAGADLLFAPAVDEGYPAGFVTTVEGAGLRERLAG